MIRIIEDHEEFSKIRDNGNSANVSLSKSEEYIYYYRFSLFLVYTVGHFY